MKTSFQLLLSLKTLAGFEAFGEYWLGNERISTEALFESLQGSETLSDEAILHIDLVETPGMIPARVRTKCCKLDELAANIKLITREIFRQKNLKAYEE